MAETPDGFRSRLSESSVAASHWDLTRNVSHVSGNAHRQSNGNSQSERLGPFQISPETLVQSSMLANGTHSISGIAIRSFLLGLVFAVGICATIALSVWGWSLWRLPFFFVALSLFHFLEFYTTARWNTSAADLGAFLLTSNGSAYQVAHSLAALETTIMHSILVYPTLLPYRWNNLVLAAGFMLLICGQVARSTAMAQAGTNFNHKVQSQRKTGHELVSTGIYSFLRHPSYFGFFWWALGTQIVLGNFVCFFAYVIVLWRFFSRRIQGEERLLIQFFGDNYIRYRQNTFVWIPFIP